MTSWFAKSLGDGMTASELSDEIEKAFLPLFVAAGRPPDMAVFTRYDSEGRLQCEATAFFSPAAAHLAAMFDAEPCTKPSREGLDLLAGDPQCWEQIFGEV